MDYYVAALTARAAQCVAMMASSEGGMDIEEVAHAAPEKILTVFVDPALGLTDAQARELTNGIGVPEASQAQAIAVLQKLYKTYDQQAAHLLAVGACLMGDELHAQDLAGDGLDLVDRAGQLDAAALAAAAGVDLGLDHSDAAAELLRRLDRLLHGEGGDAARHRHAELAQDVFGLVFMDLQGGLLGDWRVRVWRPCLTAG